MKNTAFFPALIFFTVFLASCDKIVPPYLTNNEQVDTAKCPVPDFPLLSMVIKNVLIEDFTGHKCGNCPKAHEELKNIIEANVNRIVGVSLHVSFYADPSSTGLYTYDFRTTEATAIDQYFHVSDIGLPNGLVNRKKYNGSMIVPHTSWATATQSYLTETAEIAMQIINNYDAADSSFCTHIKVTFLRDFSDTLMFFCGLKEDSIIKPQKDYYANPTDIPQYNHMHVFRDGLNGNFGVMLDVSKSRKDSSLVKSYLYNLKGRDYVHKNLKIYAFVYKLSDDEVLQAGEQKVIQ